MPPWHSDPNRKSQRLFLKTHLLFCRDCRNYLRSYELTIRVAKAALLDLDGPPPPEMPEELVKAILASHDGASSA